MDIVPVVIYAPAEEAADPPAAFPVMFVAPVPELLTPTQKLPDPPVAFPLTFSVPDPVLLAPCAVETVPPVQLPTINPTAGEAAVNCKQLREVVVDLLVTLAVSVTPLASVKMPVPALLTSSQVVLTSIVTVCPVLARASSPTVGTTPPVQVAPALKFPVPAEVIRAMA
jgi:hypothetical protein